MTGRSIFLSTSPVSRRYEKRIRLSGIPVPVECALAKVTTKSLMDLRPDELKGIIGDIPPLPAINQELFRRMHDPDILLPALAEIIAQDQALSAKILILVNSAF